MDIITKQITYKTLAEAFSMVEFHKNLYTNDCTKLEITRVQVGAKWVWAVTVIITTK